MTQLLPLSALVAELQRLCQEQRTGMFLINTEDNRMAQINLEEGRIVYLFFGKQRGEEAMPLLKEITAGRCRFAEGPVPAFRTTLPDTDDILDYLSTWSELQAGSPVAEVPEVADVTDVKPEPVGVGVGAGLSDADKVILREELTEFIGPMGAIVCEERLRGVRDLETALDSLAQVLEDPEQARRFKENVRRRV